MGDVKSSSKMNNAIKNDIDIRPNKVDHNLVRKAPLEQGQSQRKQEEEATDLPKSTRKTTI